MVPCRCKSSRRQNGLVEGSWVNLHFWDSQHRVDLTLRVRIWSHAEREVYCFESTSNGNSRPFPLPILRYLRRFLHCRCGPLRDSPATIHVEVSLFCQDPQGQSRFPHKKPGPVDESTDTRKPGSECQSQGYTSPGLLMSREEYRTEERHKSRGSEGSDRHVEGSQRADQ